MTTLPSNIFDVPTFNRATIGFDRLFSDFENAFQNSKSVSYPPYNIIETAEDEYLIELAVAGFKKEDFDIELHKNILTVRGSTGPENLDDGRAYLHRGIASRSFERKFTLAETVEVEDVSLHNGMLMIKLVNRIPEELQPKKLEVKSIDK